MPFPIAAAIGAGSNLVGGAVNAFSTANQNRKSRDWSEKMYEKQKQDNYVMWNMQNEYNTPANQLQRMKDANLNPHLFYGQGNPGNAAPIPTPDVQSPQFRTPEWGNAVSSAGLAFMNAIYDLDIKQAQIDNLKAQNTVIHQDAMLKAVLGDDRRFDLNYKSRMEDVSAEAAKERLRQTKVSIDLSIREDARRAAANSSSIEEAAQRMLSMQAERGMIPYRKGQMAASTAESRERINQMLKDGKLKDLDIELRNLRINPQDPMWARMIGGVLTDIYESPSLGDLGSSIWKWLSGGQK